MTLNLTFRRSWSWGSIGWLRSRGEARGTGNGSRTMVQPNLAGGVRNGGQSSASPGVRWGGRGGCGVVGAVVGAVRLGSGDRVEHEFTDAAGVAALVFEPDAVFVRSGPELVRTL